MSDEDRMISELRRLVARGSLWDNAPAVRALFAAYDRQAGRIAEAISLHADAGISQGYTANGYGDIQDCCDSCGTFGEYGVPFPCETLRALSGAEEGTPHE